MFIELAEYLKCANDHPEEPLVVATGAMKERAIVFGTIGCPVCHAEYTIVDRVARFGAPPPLAMEAPDIDPDAVLALLGLTSPGGYVVLVGSAGLLADQLMAVLDGVHFAAVNGPDSARPGRRLTLIEGERHIPLRTGMARGVVVGEEYGRSPWVEEATRVLLGGQRLVALTETIEPAGLTETMRGGGLWAGEKR